MPRFDEGAGHRHARLQGLVLEELRALFREDVSDPRLAMVAVRAVVLSVDYRNVRVHWVAREEVEQKKIEVALAHATPFLRSRLGESIEWKRLPELRFVFDGVLAEGVEDPCPG